MTRRLLALVPVLAVVAGACSGISPAITTSSSPSPAASAPASAVAFQGRILFYSERDGNNEIYLMNADGTGLERLTDDPADDRDPVWSPDGTKIAFASNREGQDEDLDL
jgi:Tol biopolymer transport system component